VSRSALPAVVRHEVPPDVVREAIVNAIAHRDYASAAAVQVSVFADRVEVWNPGQLPPPLTPERLRHPHSSIARNHRITNADYQGLVGGSRRTAFRELEGLVRVGVFVLQGRGRGASYLLAKECVRNAPNAPAATSGRPSAKTASAERTAPGKSAINRPIRPSAQTRPKPAKPDTAKPASNRPAPKKPKINSKTILASQFLVC
jgi:hypothetical protein